MVFIKIKELHFIIIILAISLIPELIKSQNLCPFPKLNESLHYYAKGINPSKCNDCFNYTIEYVHCVNGYHNKTYLLRDKKDDNFNQKAGIFIASSIDIAYLKKEFINTNFTLLDSTQKEILNNLTEKYGKDAEDLFPKMPLNLTFKQTNEINLKVYQLYYREMLDFFHLGNKTDSDKKYYGYNFEINLLTFFVKYYGKMDYLIEAKNILDENIGNNLQFLSYYFLNMKSDNYYQRKLWSQVTLSSDKTYYNNNVTHIGIYIGARLLPEFQNLFKSSFKYFVNSFNYTNYYFSLGNLSGLYFNEPLNSEEFYKKIDEYNFCNNSIEHEDIDEGIKFFENVFNKSLKGINSFYQKHLIIFINDIKSLIGKLDLEYFIQNGIQVILVSKVKAKSQENLLRNYFDDKFNLITFTNYSDLNSSLNMLRSAIISNVKNYYINDTKNKIKINNILTSTKDNMQHFKIIFQNNTKKQNDIYKYFHISLIYNDISKIQSLYKNNSNITFLLSKQNPYVDIISYDIVNFCLNTTISLDKDKSPFINYVINDTIEDFVYVTIMANDMNYSLEINLLSSSKEPKKSNGEFGKNSVSQNQEELITTFNDKLIEKRCSVDYFSFLKYFSSGVHYINANDTFHEILDMNMIECLYKNVYGPYFEIEKTSTQFDDGPFIGYRIDLSKETCLNLKKNNVPLYLINKLYPFLYNSLDKKNSKETLENFNLNLTKEEIHLLNINYFTNILNKLISSHTKFKYLSDHLKLAIFLRIIEQHPTDQQINQYLNFLTTKNLDKYLQILNNTAKSRMSTELSINFQLMLTQIKNIYKPKKLLLSIVIGKSLLWTDEFLELLSKISSYRLSITYYDREKNEMILLEDFIDGVETIIKKICDIRNNTNFTKIETINTDLILKQQLSLFKYYDVGVKKCIVFISTKKPDNCTYEFTKPDENLLQELNDKGILIFDYSDHINFILDNKTAEYNFYNSTKSEFIQYIPFLNISDMGKNYLTLTNMINRYPIPINKFEDIYLDLEPDEEIFFEFNLDKTLYNKRQNNSLDGYDQLKFNFDASGFQIYFSDKYIYPDNYSNQAWYFVDEKNKSFYYQIKNENISNKFYMAIYTSNKVDNSLIYFDLCNKDGTCLKGNFYFKFYISFIVFGGVIFFYGIYIIGFSESTFKKESNIFKTK